MRRCGSVLSFVCFGILLLGTGVGYGHRGRLVEAWRDDNRGQYTVSAPNTNFSPVAVAPAHIWSQRFGSPSQDGSWGVAVDGSGNVFVTGLFEGTVNFGGADLVSAGGFDIFVAKFNANGAHQWSQRFGSTGYDTGYGIAVDSLGNVVVTGFFEGGVDFGGGSLVSAGLSDIFVAKFNANGAHQWSQRFGSTGFDSGEAVAVDRSGNVLVTGGFEGTVDFGGGDLVGAGYKDVFVAKYDPSGAHEWSCRFGGTGYEEGYGIAVDGLESAVVTGYFEGGVDFGGGSLVSAGLEDIFVAKYDSSGTHHWSRRFGSTGSDYGEAVAVDGSGNVVVTGFFGGGVDFGGGSLTSAGLEDIFVAKYDSSGTHQWSQRFGSTGYDDGYGVAVDASGEVVATGVFEGTADFGGGDLISAGYSDIYVAKYNANGAHEWSQRFGGTADDYGEDVAVDGSGKSLLTGEFIGTVNFGGGDLVSAGSTDIFLLKLGDEMPVPVLISRFDATPRRGGVELAWEFSSDEALKGFTLNRGRGQASAMIATGDARTTHSYMDVSVEPGETYEYELLVRTASGDEFSSPTVTVTMPRAVTALAQNLPNPFNPQTTISFTHAERARATLSVYDVKGRLVRTLVDEMIGEGYQERVWDGKDASGSQVGSGVYFYRLTAGDKTLTKKMVFLK